MQENVCAPPTIQIEQTWDAGAKTADGSVIVKIIVADV